MQHPQWIVMADPPPPLPPPADLGAQPPGWGTPPSGWGAPPPGWGGQPPGWAATGLEPRIHAVPGGLRPLPVDDRWGVARCHVHPVPTQLRADRIDQRGGADSLCAAHPHPLRGHGCRRVRDLAARIAQPADRDAGAGDCATEFAARCLRGVGRGVAPRCARGLSARGGGDDARRQRHLPRPAAPAPGRVTRCVEPPRVVDRDDPAPRRRLRRLWSRGAAPRSALCGDRCSTARRPDRGRRVRGPGAPDRLQLSIRARGPRRRPGAGLRAARPPAELATGPLPLLGEFRAPPAHRADRGDHLGSARGHLRAARGGAGPGQHLHLPADRQCYRTGLRRTDHLHRRDSSVLRRAHPQRGIRHRDARQIAVRRLLIAVFAGVLVLTGAAAGGAHATAAPACVTTTYIGLLDSAHAALTAEPPQPGVALTALMRAEALVPSTDAVLGPIIAGLTSTPSDASTSRQRLDLTVTHPA